MKKIRVVQIGTGHDHSFAAINFLNKREDIDFLGYVRVKDETKVFSGITELSYADVLKEKDIDAAFIETEDKYLTEYAYEFIKRGIAVQMDKPGSQDKESFDRLFNLAKSKKTPLHLGYMYRYNPAIKKLCKMVKDGELGKIYYVEARMNCLHTEDKRKWLKDYKGGMMNFLGCHLVDVVLRLQGKPDEIIPYNSVSCTGVGEDIGFAVFKYGDNASFIRSTGVETGGFMRRQIVVCCENGTVEINPTESFDENGNVFTDMYVSLKSENGDNWWHRPQKTRFGPYDRYEEMYDEFFRIVRGEIENPYSYDYEKSLHDTLLKACGITEQ